jgi:hypothetical protein
VARARAHRGVRRQLQPGPMRGLLQQVLVHPRLILQAPIPTSWRHAEEARAARSWEHGKIERVTYEDPGGERGGGPAEGDAGEGDLGGGVLGLAERGAAAGALEGLAVEGDGGPEARRVVGPLPRAHVRRQAEAAPLRQLLQLVLVHPYVLAALLLRCYLDV